ncbi:MAG TPA: PAS domain-containing protein, partial [Polyangia bacterium]
MTDYSFGVSQLDDLRTQNQILRERIQQLEKALPGRADPVLNALIEHAPAFLNVVTPEGRFLATGRTSDGFGSVIGRSVFEFTPPTHHAILRDAFARICATKQPVVYESVGYGENGEPNHSYVVRAVPLIENDQVVSIAIIPTDITDRVQLERSLAESEQKLRFAITATHIGLWSWDGERDQVK